MGHRKARLNLAALTFVDSSGLFALVDARNAGSDLEIVDPSPRVREVLTLTGLDDAFGLSNNQ